MRVEQFGITPAARKTVGFPGARGWGLVPRSDIVQNLGLQYIAVHGEGCLI